MELIQTSAEIPEGGVQWCRT